MERNGYRIIFLGPPGAGKGTQAEKLSRYLGIKKISTGDILREAVHNGTDLGKKAKEYMEKGELVPDDIMIGLIEEAIGSERNFILDGFPRTLKQAESLDDMLSRKNLYITHVLLMNVPDEEIITRISKRRICPKCQTVYNLVYNPPKNDEVCDRCGEKLVQRKDDSEEVVKNRLRVYKESTQPLVGFYEVRGLVKVIEGSGTPEEVFKRITEAL